MTDKQIIIEENKINPNDWLEPYKPIPACEIKDCDHLVYAGNNVYGCRIAEDGLVCDDFNNDDECCMYRQLEYYKEALKAKEQECEKLETARHLIETSRYNWEYRAKSKERECESLNRWLPIISRLEMAFGSYEKAKAIDYKSYIEQIFAELDQLKAENEGFKILHKSDKGLITATGKMNYQLLQEYDKLKTENKRLEDLYDRVLQTLTDIEIITQQGIDFFNETERHADWKKVAIFMKQQLNFILGEIEEG